MIAIIDSRLPSDARDGLLRHGHSLVSLPPFSALAEPVAGHPDMLIFLVDDKLFTYRDYYALARPQLDSIRSAAQLEVVLCDDAVSGIYPYDVRLNLLRVGRYVFGRRASASHHILEYCKQNNIEFIDIRQGYAKCSTCVVSDNAIITADRGIADAAWRRGIDVLSIHPGGVLLPGYDTGFIGGAAGCDRENVYFAGDLSLHRDGDAIKDFCRAHKKRAVSLSNSPLYDAGTIFFVHPAK